MCIYMWISITGNDGVIFWRGSQGTGKFTEQEDFKKYLWGKIANKYGKIFEKNHLFEPEIRIDWKSRE